MRRKQLQRHNMRHLFPAFVLGFLGVSGCSGPRLRVKADSPLKEAIVKFSNEWEESPTSWGIRDQIYTVLPPGSSESKVIEHIKLHFMDGPGSRERVFGQADEDYFYRVEAFRSRVQVWYCMKDGKLVKIVVANMRSSL